MNIRQLPFGFSTFSHPHSLLEINKAFSPLTEAKSIRSYMDALEASNEFQDWEVLHSDSGPEPDPVQPAASFNPMDEIDSEGSIQVNYFSLEAQSRRRVDELDDNKSYESDNPSWIDPVLDENPTRYLNKESCEFWSDSSSERSEDRKFKDFAQNSEVGSERNVILHHESEVSSIEKDEIEKMKSGGVVKDDTGNNRSGENTNKGVMWWKMPMEFLRYCVFRMSPVWGVSMAATALGFMILGHRLYKMKMKKKARGLQIKVTVDDKKVSQVMSRAARLNEAFSVVKRVPVIRPSFPALGTTNWHVMASLR